MALLRTSPVVWHPLGLKPGHKSCISRYKCIYSEEHEEVEAHQAKTDNDRLKPMKEACLGASKPIYFTGEQNNHIIDEGYYKQRCQPNPCSQEHCMSWGNCATTSRDS